MTRTGPASSRARSRLSRTLRLGESLLWIAVTLRVSISERSSGVSAQQVRFIDIDEYVVAGRPPKKHPDDPQEHRLSLDVEQRAMGSAGREREGVVRCRGDLREPRQNVAPGSSFQPNSDCEAVPPTGWKARALESSRNPGA